MKYTCMYMIRPLDPHIRPIWSSCPFCTIDFDIIGHLEDRDSDALFIANKLKFGVRKKQILILFCSKNTISFFIEKAKN